MKKMDTMKEEAEEKLGIGFRNWFDLEKIILLEIDFGAIHSIQKLI